MQTTDTLLMIRPVQFGFNPETAINNYFQTKGNSVNTQIKALKEFDDLVKLLRNHKINVLVFEDTPTPHTPDSIFPNNWVTFQSDSNVVLFPMNAKNRRLERRQDILNALKNDFQIDNIVDFTNSEKDNRFLEGTGSMVLDHENKLAYGCVSNRLDKKLFIEYCNFFNYQPIAFRGFQTVNNQRMPIYHTNVTMCIAKEFVVICLDAIDNESERESVIQHILDSGKELLEISESQMHDFAGNMLQVHNTEGKSFIVMSDRAYHSLDTKQIELIQQYSEILHTDLTTIETNGGGSARCMLAEVFLPKK